MPTPHPAPPTAPDPSRAVPAAARRIARRQLSYGYFRSIHAMTTPYVYCPARHEVKATVAAAATAAPVCAALRAELTAHLIDNNETTTNAGR